MAYSNGSDNFDGKTNPRAQGSGGPKPRDMTQPQQEGRGPGWLPAFESRQQQKAGESIEVNRETIPAGGKDVLVEANPRGDTTDVQKETRPFRVS